MKKICDARRVLSVVNSFSPYCEERKTNEKQMLSSFSYSPLQEENRNK